MYKIILNNTHEIQTDIDKVVIKPKLKEKVNSAGELEYIIPYDDEFFYDYEEKVTLVEVKYAKRTEFKGILAESTKMFDGSKKVIFEGELTYLNNVLYPPYSFAGDYDEYFRNFIDYYNSKVDDSRKMIVGRVTMIISLDQARVINQFGKKSMIKFWIMVVI